MPAEAGTRRFDVVGIGVATLDLLHLVDELPGDELVQRAHECVLQGGGPVATALVALARLGSTGAMLDVVGDDWRGKAIVEELRQEGVATEDIVMAKGRTSSIASIFVRKGDGARAIAYAPGDAEDLFLSDAHKRLIVSARVLHLNGRHYDACIAAADMARQHGVLVSFDGGAHRYRNELREIVARAGVCIVARHFACSFSGVEDVEASARSMLDAGPETVVVTAGTEGSWVFEKGEKPFHQPAFSIKGTVDTTGAGDAFHGGFLYGIVNGMGVRGAARLAAAVAAMNTRRLGGRSALPSLHEVEAFLATASGCG